MSQLMFTSYTRTEADMKVVTQVAKVENCDFKIVCDGNLNPFRDHRPFRNFIGFKTDVIYYYNGYLKLKLKKIIKISN